jgi:NAD dependent epimerase/dehydratase
MISKRINCLVTGADGFIGSHLTELLLEKGYNVKALAQYNSFNFRGWLEEIPTNPNLEIIVGDIRDSHFCNELVKGTDIVYHLAALISIPYSYITPDSYLDTNIRGTLNICQAAKEAGCIKLLNTSTSEVYGTAQYVPIDENHPKQPQSPYSASKIAADAIAMSFYYTFGLAVTNVRPFNTYGPRQSARAVIPTIITQIASGVKQIKLGELLPTRDFNFVKDTCSGFIAIAECNEATGKEINISSNSEISIRDTLYLIKELMNSDVEFVMDEQRIRPKNSEVFRLWGDNSLLRDLTGWLPSTTMKQGLEETIKWFSRSENLLKFKAGIYNL